MVTTWVNLALALMCLRHLAWTSDLCCWISSWARSSYGFTLFLVNWRLEPFLAYEVGCRHVIKSHLKIAGGAFIKASGKRVSACLSFEAGALTLAPGWPPSFFRRSLFSLFYDENFVLINFKTVAGHSLTIRFKVTSLHRLKPGVWLWVVIRVDVWIIFH